MTIYQQHLTPLLSLHRPSPGQLGSKSYSYLSLFPPFSPVLVKSGPLIVLGYWEARCSLTFQCNIGKRGALNLRDVK
jgi:hypothetical protein